MTGSLMVQNSIRIDAPIDRVWDALVNPELTKIYMFGCEAISDWVPGSPLVWKGSYDGKEMIFVKGYIVDIFPPRLLKYTVIDPNSGMQDIPENYLNVLYTLLEENRVTELSVIQDGFEKADRGEERYREVYNNGEGWNPILLQIKKILEEK